MADEDGVGLRVGVRVLERDGMRVRVSEIVTLEVADWLGGGSVGEGVAEDEVDGVLDLEGVSVLDEVKDDERVADGVMGAARQNRKAVSWKPSRRACSGMSSNNTIPPSPAAFSTPAENWREFCTSRDEA